MEKNNLFDQSLGLKKVVLSEICSLVFQPVKDIVNKQQEKYISKLQDKKTPQSDQKKESLKQKEPIFKGYFGKYLSDKDIARDVQKSFIRKQLISEEQVDLFNTLSVEYRNLKQLVLQKDLRIVQSQEQRVEFDRNLINLAIQSQDFGSVETDANQNIMCREKMYLRLQRQSKSNSFILEPKARLGNTLGADSKVLGINESSKRRFSLVPYDQYRNSLIQVGRESNNMSETSQRRSRLFESFNGQIRADDPSFKELNINTEKLLDFFSMNASANGD